MSSVKLEPLRQESEEAEMILKYMYRSRGAADHRVWAIFRLGDASTPELAAATHNRKLLWHGTKRANLLRKAIISEQLNLTTSHELSFCTSTISNHD